jgi:predicted MFS family arabinose efflux permease
LAPVAGMLFLVNYVARDLDAGVHTGNAFWVIYGIGAVAGPPIYGYVIDRLGAVAAVRTIFLSQCAALTAMGFVHSLSAVGALSFITGTFTSGVVPLILGWLRECIPGNPERQNIVWSKSTIVFATSQALGGYAASALLAAGQVNHRMLFLLGAAAMGLALVVDLVASRMREPDPVGVAI